MKPVVYTILVTAVTCMAAATGEPRLTVAKPLAKRSSSGLSESSHVLKLKKGAQAAASSSYLKTFRASAASDDDIDDHPEGVTSAFDSLSASYLAEIEFNGEPVNVILDTGSSDTWVIQDGFTCVDVSNNTLSPSDCSFGPTYQGTFSGGAISDEYFEIEYADGHYLSGAFGYEAVTVAGVTVENQQVALVDFAYWAGDNVSSGLMGLAYPALTSAYSATADAQGMADQVTYDPIITTMIEQGLIDPLFSLALERDSDLGSLALGGLPPSVQTGDFASTPILMLDLTGRNSDFDSEYSFYTIIADAWVYEGSDETTVNTGTWGKLARDTGITTNTTQFPTIVDSGTTLTYLPTEMIQDVLALFDPPGFYSDDFGVAVTSCNASVPHFGVQIGGQEFKISEADLLIQSQNDPATGLCLIGIQDGTNGPYVLGESFMNNVVSVFDVGAAEMHFATNCY